MSPESADADLFVAAVDDDYAWVEGFLLPELGLPRDQVRTEYDFLLGRRRIDEMERAISTSRYTLLIVRPAALADTRLAMVERLATQLDLAGGQSRLIVVVREETQPLPPHLRALVQLDCRGTDAEQWSHEIRKLRRQLALPEAPAASLPNPYPGMRPFSEETAVYFFSPARRSHRRSDRPSGCGLWRARRGSADRAPVSADRSATAGRAAAVARDATHPVGAAHAAAAGAV